MNWLTSPAPVPFWALIVFMLAYGAICLWTGYELAGYKAAELAGFEADLDDAAGAPDVEMKQPYRDQALTEPCPTCGAGPGERCTPHAGYLIHSARADAWEIGHYPIDDRGGDAGDAATVLTAGPEPGSDGAAAAALTRPAAAALAAFTPHAELPELHELPELLDLDGLAELAGLAERPRLRTLDEPSPEYARRLVAGQMDPQPPEAEPMRPGRQTLIAAGLDRMSTVIFQSDEVTVARYAGPDMGPDYPRGRIQISLTSRVDGGLPRHLGLTYTQWAYLVEAAAAIGAVPAEAEEVSD